jgi:hypothetical protein
MSNKLRQRVMNLGVIGFSVADEIEKLDRLKLDFVVINASFQDILLLIAFQTPDSFSKAFQDIQDRLREG